MITRDTNRIDPRLLRARRHRNIAIGLAVGALCLLFYAVTIVKLGPGLFGHPI